jgi:AraC-like DNA-binding protein
MGGSHLSPSRDWIVLRRDAETGIETVRAHFEGHAYDPHDHDEVLLGVTEAGVQQFRCRGRVQRSTPGRVILIEPGEVHDGESPESGGFTYAMLYLPLARLREELEPLGPADIGFRETLADAPRLGRQIRRAIAAVHRGEGRLARDLALAGLAQLIAQPSPSPTPARGRLEPRTARARDLIEEAFAQDLSLADLCAASGLDRFALTRAFRRAFGLSPHAYLVQVRLKAVRRALAAGASLAAAAADAGFFDQSHMGRWFRRAYGFTPGTYAAACTSVPD